MRPRALSTFMTLVLLALVGSMAPPAPAAPADAAHCLFLPLLSSPGSTATGGDVEVDCREAAEATPTATSTSPATGTPSPSPTATETQAPVLSGAVRLLPEHALVEVRRQPQQYVVVLDASGSMSANFAGQCDAGPGAHPGGQSYWQCANGPDGAPAIQVVGTGPTYYWGEPSERRIYVAKKAIERLVRRLNMPGNDGYDASRPADQLALVWFNQMAPAAHASGFSSDQATILSTIADAGSYNSDPYRTAGGTNWGAGLFRASLLLNSAPAAVQFGGEDWTYDRKLVFFTDGVSNQFLDKATADLNGGTSGMMTYPEDNPCYVPNVLEIAACQVTGDGVRGGGLTTGGGGVPAGLDRPITQAVQVSAEDLQAHGVAVAAVSLSNLSSIGLQDGVASTPSAYFAAETLQVNPDGTTNVDLIIDSLQMSAETGTCTPVVAADWQATMAPEHVPEGAGEMAFPQVGLVQLQHIESGAQAQAPVLVDEANRMMGYRFVGLAPGSYRLVSAVFFKGADQETRGYSLIETTAGPQAEITVEVSGASQELDRLSLRLLGDVCAAR